MHPETYIFTFRPVVLLLLGAATVVLGTVVLVRERWSRGSFAFWLYMASLAAWLIGFGMASASVDRDTARAWFVASISCVLFIPSMMLVQAAFMSQRERTLRPLLWSCMTVSSLFVVALLSTSSIIREFQRFPWGWYPRFGWAGALFMGYFAAVVSVATSIILAAYRSSTHPRNRARLRLVLVAFGIGSLTAVDFAPCFGLPLYPVGYIFYAGNLAVTAWIIVHYRLMEIRPELTTDRVLETMQGVVIVADLEGRVSLVNRAAQEMLGVRREDLIGKDLSHYIPLPAVVREAVRQGVRTGPHESVWSSTDGRQLHMSLWIAPILDGRDNAPVGTVYVAHDITERRLAEEQLLIYSEELREANTRLEALDRLKSEVVSTVSHELRTPLTSIKAFAELLLIKPAMLLERKEQLLRKINDESDRLSRLINDLLDLSRIEAGTAIWHPGPVSVQAIIDSSVDSILPLAQNKGLELTIDPCGPLPDLLVDEDRLVQVMTNLLSNAVKFTPPGGTITVRAHQEEGPPSRVVLTVADTGMGIPAADLPYIFDKFHRAGVAEAGGIEGTGLGLTIARQIVEHHNGSISVVSMLGQGSAFSVVLPCAEQLLPQNF
jgi:PAS domain S-box-containing protein